MAQDIFRFHFDERQALEAFDAIGKKAPAVLARVLNRTGTSGRALLARNIAADIGLSVGTVREEIKFRPAIAQDERPTVVLSVSGSKIPLAKFGASGPFPSKGRGSVSARIGGQRKRYPGRFLVQFSNGKVGVFGRFKASERKSAGAWSKNLPIAELFGPSLPHVFGKHIPAAVARMEEQLVKNLEHELGFALAQVTG